VKLKSNDSWASAGVELNNTESKYIGCIIQHSGSWLHPVYTTFYLGVKGWTDDEHQAYRMTKEEALKFKARGGVRVWTKPNVPLMGSTTHV
jgi:hypothetical protein